MASRLPTSYAGVEVPMSAAPSPIESASARLCLDLTRALGFDPDEVADVASGLPHAVRALVMSATHPPDDEPTEQIDRLHLAALMGERKH